MKNKSWIIFVVVMFCLSAEAFAQAPFPEITINLSYPQFQRLRTDGGFVYLEGGLKGIILYRIGEDAFVAYDRACPHDPYAACAVVQVDGSSLFMIDRCCRANFSFSDGQPTGGPVSRPLVQYRVEIVGKVLKITDEIIN